MRTALFLGGGAPSCLLTFCSFWQRARRHVSQFSPELSMWRRSRRDVNVCSVNGECIAASPLSRRFCEATCNATRSSNSKLFPLIKLKFVMYYSPSYKAVLSKPVGPEFVVYIHLTSEFYVRRHPATSNSCVWRVARCRTAGVARQARSQGN